ncbi:MAG TPA: phenylacetic acid degradation operon negative regulatory protein PaaX [Bryobacteraceae bacterium]|jgi:phenylacetic acid degradation operon negative regulatory protein|nr:phenylacetic acid degradation operon negative regulatory protein PaaX [Bryobacteraceae bacterium]
MKRKAPIEAWIPKFLTSDPPRAKSLVVTIFGDSIAPHGESIWLQSLIDLLRPFGVNERLVRSSVFRLVEEEWLVAERHGRQSRYSFTASGRKRFERAHDRIYFASERRWNGEWMLVIVPPAKFPAKVRAALQRELAWEGFRRIAPGTFARPAGDRWAVEEIAERAGAAGKIALCSARDFEPAGRGSLRQMIERYWDLRGISGAYGKFIRRFGALLGMMPREGVIAPEQAFVIRTLLIHSFRRVLLHDPRLPAELLPDDWLGRKAYELCRSLYHLTYLDSEQHMRRVLGPAAVARPAPYFQDRFGGLPVPPEVVNSIQIRA